MISGQSLKDPNTLAGTTDMSEVHSFSAWDSRSSGRHQGKQTPRLLFWSLTQSWNQPGTKSWSKARGDQVTIKFIPKTEMNIVFLYLRLSLNSSCNCKDLDAARSNHTQTHMPASLPLTSGLRTCIHHCTDCSKGSQDEHATSEVLDLTHPLKLVPPPLSILFS